MKKIFIVAYEFYPENTGGAHRPYRIAKYLSQSNYDVEVVTTDIAKNSQDLSLVKLLNACSFKVTRIPIKKASNLLSQSYYFSVTDNSYKTWKSEIIKYFEKEILHYSQVSVIITLPPFSFGTLLIDLRLRYSKLHLIADFRDAWSLWNTSPYASKFHYKSTVKQERRVFSAADHVIVTSPVTMQDFMELHPSIPKSRFVYVPNSFDQFHIHPKQIEVSNADKLSIGYVGSFYFNPVSHDLMFKKWYQKKPYQYFQYVPYRENWLYRTPYFLFKAISELLDKYPQYRSKIEVNLVGNHPGWLLGMIDEFQLNKVVNLRGFIDKTKIDQFLQQQDFLFITSSLRIGKKDYSIAGKTFEYLAQMKPILAFVTPGAQLDLLEESGISVIVDADKTKEAAEKMEQIIVNGCTLKPNYQKLNRYLTTNALSPLLEIL